MCTLDHLTFGFRVLGYGGYEPRTSKNPERPKPQMSEKTKRFEESPTSENGPRTRKVTERHVVSKSVVFHIFIFLFAHFSKKRLQRSSSCSFFACSISNPARSSRVRNRRIEVVTSKAALHPCLKNWSTQDSELRVYL